MKKKKLFIILATAVVFVLVLAFGAIGVNAWFVDQETSEGNEIAAGTLDLKVDDKDDPEVVNFEIGNIAPGWNNIYKWVLKNDGSLPGVVKISIANVEEIENGINEPEQQAEDFMFKPAGCSLQTVGIAGSGELGYFLKAVPSKSNIFPSVEKSPGVPCPNSWMPNGGGLHYLGTIGFFELGRNTAEATLAPGTAMEFWLKLSLDENLRAWDGCSWHDIDDNVIQSDIVKFDVVFKLEQAQ
jgi:predicted ribosomally synthesized peptide with SipW-like signal peptide